MGVITLSFRLTIQRVRYLARLMIWRIFFSLPLLTWPAAKAAFYAGAAAGLRDPFEQRVNLRAVFVRAFFDHLVRSTLLALINTAALGVMLFSIVFWASREEFALNLLAGVALPFLVFWWMCQPYLYAYLVEHTGLGVLDVIRDVVRITFGHPGFSFVTAFSLTWFFILSLPLFGPLSLMTVPFLVIYAVQSYWVAAGVPIPDRIDPVEYADQQDEEAAAGEEEKLQ